MGNSEQTISQSAALQHFSKRFLISGHPLDPEQAIMFYLHEKLSDNKYILRIVSTNDNEDKQRIQDLVCKKLAMNKNNRNKKINLTPIDHYLFEHEKGYCNSVNKCYLLFDVKNSQPISHYLARGHYNRKSVKTINQQTIYKGLLNLVQGVALLKHYNHPHRYINCDTVYYQPIQKSFILADPWISPLNDTHEQYHAPQKLKQMKNQTEKHDPYLADLFSIAMVGLKVLGHNNISEYYSIHKTLDQKGLIKLTQNIQNYNLKSLLHKLLSQNIQIRQQVLNQIKFNTSTLKNDLNQSNVTTKTRNLSGKVASVRKSFINDNRLVSRININKPYPQQNNNNNNTQPYINIPYHNNNMNIIINGMQQNNMNFKKKDTYYDINKQYINNNNNQNNNNIYKDNIQLSQYQPINININNNPTIQSKYIKNDNINQKPQIDLNFTIPSPVSPPLYNYTPQYTTTHHQNITMPIFPTAKQTPTNLNVNSNINNINLNSNYNKPNYEQYNTIYNNIHNIPQISTISHNSSNMTNIAISTTSQQGHYNNNNNMYNNNIYNNNIYNNNNIHTNSYSSLNNSSSDKLLKNVSSSPINYNNYEYKTNNTTLFTSLSQNGLLFNTTNTNNNIHNNSNPQIKQTKINQLLFNKIIPTTPTSTNLTNINNNINNMQIFSKPQQIVSIIKLNKNSNNINNSNNSNVGSPPNNQIKLTTFVTPIIQKQKQKAPLKTSPSYRQSQSFESDHFYQNKIYQNLKILQNKVSQAINSSRLNVTDSRASNSNYSGIILQNSNGRLIQSVIMPKLQDNSNSSHSNTVHAITEQLKTIEQANQIKQINSVIRHINIKQQNKQQNKQYIQSPNSNKQIIRQLDRDRQQQSPILVRQSDNIIHTNIQIDRERRLSDEHTGSNQQSVDYLNINSSKQSQSEIQKQNQSKKQQIQQKYQDVVTTPAKQPSTVRLQGNNLTIPEQSDEQSMQGNQQAKDKGDYVQQAYQNGGKYVGYMLNGQRNGNGIFYYRDGGYYDGRWKNNMMNGYGKLYYETGKIAYEGQWYQDQFHGRGTVYNDQPDQISDGGFDYRNMNQSQNCWHYYQGDLSHDMKARYGKLMLSNNQYYQGQFKNDQVHGKGQFHRFDGTIVKGIWEHGIFIKQL